MKTKKGFTLIELLAVIVILAIIALIATPIIVGVINDAKKNAFLDTGYGMIEAAKLYYAGQYGNDDFIGKTFNFSKNIDDLKLSGEKPGGGLLSIDKDGTQSFMVWNKDKSFCMTKDFSEEKIKIEDFGTSKCKNSLVENMTGFMKDQSGKGNDGINYGAILNKGYATFDGKSYIDAGFSSYDFKDTATVVVRFKKSSFTPGKYETLLSNWENAGVGISTKGEVIRFGAYSKNFVELATTKLSSNQYYTIVGVYNNEALFLYMDGVLVSKATIAENVKVAPVPIYVGSNPQADGSIYEAFTGDISDALVFDRAMTEEEVKQYFTNEIPLIKDEKLLFQYKF